ncbi:murein transglycosylase A [Sulfurimonas sp.]
MKHILYFITIIFLILGCTKEPKVVLKDYKNTHLKEESFQILENFTNEDFNATLEHFRKNCKSKKVQNIYAKLCQDVQDVNDSKTFILQNFKPYKIVSAKREDTGLLTGYYEPLIHASLKKNNKYMYPLYATPQDLVTVDLSSIYPELKHYRLRGRLQGNKLVPYFTRAQSALNDINASIICYCDSKVDKFFLEIQGSGKVLLDDNSTMNIGYDNQNGHKYKAIGRYLVSIGALSIDAVSLQSIRAWLDANPSRVDEVLNYNDSLVFFSQREQGATGALGFELTPKRSVAVDKRYIPLGSMLYLSSDINGSKINKIVFAEDTGGAIKGAIRADYFLGSGKEAAKIAGHLKSPLKLWILLPESEVEYSNE